MNDLVGIPYVTGGRDPVVGVDCVGLLELALERFGIRWRCFVNTEDAEAMADTLSRQQCSPIWRKIEEAEARPGDVVVLNRHHVGILVDGGVLHSTRGHGSCIQSVTALRRSRYPVIAWYRYCG